MAMKRRREVGKTKDVGYQIGVRRTMDIPLEQAWNLVTSSEGVRLWLGSDERIQLKQGVAYELKDGVSGETRVFEENSHLRVTWHPPDWPRASTIQVRVIPKDKRSVIAFHQEHLPGPKEREARRAFFKCVLDQLEKLIQA
jgi:uncharacterized protein YndB with AHSA1/START domain